MTESTDANKPTPANETVLMEDGSKIEFSPKKKVIKKIDISDQGTVKLDLLFRNGAMRTFIFTQDDKTYARAAAHGYSQKLGDEGAGLSVEDMVQSIDELSKRLDLGEWTTKREGGAAAGGSILARALVEATKRAEETDAQARDRVNTWLANKFTVNDSMSTEQKKQIAADKLALRNSARLKPIIDRLEAEAAQKKTANIDTDALLADLAGE